MAIERKNEILGKALPTDNEVIPRYDILDETGATVASGATLKLINPVTQKGMPYNAEFANEVLAASGTAIVSEFTDLVQLYISQKGFEYKDLAVAIIKIPQDITITGKTVAIGIAGIAQYAVLQDGSPLNAVKQLKKDSILYLVYSEQARRWYTQFLGTSPNSALLNNIPSTDFVQLKNNNSYTGTQTYQSSVIVNSSLSASQISVVGSISCTTNQSTIGGPFGGFNYIYSQHQLVVASDKNKKKDITDITEEDTKQIIEKLNPVNYRLKNNDNGNINTGFIAQDVEKILNEMGKTEKDFSGLVKRPKCKEHVKVDEFGNELIEIVEISGEYEYGLEYGSFIPLLCKYAQMQAKEIESLKKGLNTVSKQVNQLIKEKG